MDNGAGAQSSEDAACDSLLEGINELLCAGERLGNRGLSANVNWRFDRKQVPSLKEAINDLLSQSQLLHAYVIDHWHDLIKKREYCYATIAIDNAKRHEDVLRTFADEDGLEAVWHKIFRLTVKRLMVKRQPGHLIYTRWVMLVPMRFITVILSGIDGARSIDEQYREKSNYRSKLKAALKKSNKFARAAINTASVHGKRLLLRRADEELDDYDWADRAWPDEMRAVQFFARKYPDEKLPPPREDSNGSRVKRLFVMRLSDFLEKLTGERLFQEVAYFTQIVLDITIDKHEVRAILERPTTRAEKKARSRKEKRGIGHTIRESKRVP